VTVKQRLVASVRCTYVAYPCAACWGLPNPTVW